MADYRISANVHDAALTHIQNNSERQVLCSADPVVYGSVAAVTLATVNMVPGDFTIAAGDISGRKITISPKTLVTPTGTGTATHIALVDDTNSDIILLVPMPATALDPGTPVDYGQWEHEMRDNEAG